MTYLWNYKCQLSEVAFWALTRKTTPWLGLYFSTQAQKAKGNSTPTLILLFLWIFFPSCKTTAEFTKSSELFNLLWYDRVQQWSGYLAPKPGDPQDSPTGKSPWKSTNCSMSKLLIQLHFDHREQLSAKLQEHQIDLKMYLHESEERKKSKSLHFYTAGVTVLHKRSLFMMFPILLVDRCKNRCLLEPTRVVLK